MQTPSETGARHKQRPRAEEASRLPLQANMLTIWLLFSVASLLFLD